MGFWEHEDARQAARSPQAAPQETPLHPEEVRIRLAAVIDLCETAEAFGMGTLTVGEVLALATGQVSP